MISQHDLLDYDDYMIKNILTDIGIDLENSVPKNNQWIKLIKKDYRVSNGS